MYLFVFGWLMIMKNNNLHYCYEYISRLNKNKFLDILHDIWEISNLLINTKKV
jgi:hypothetical protein